MQSLTTCYREVITGYMHGAEPQQRQSFVSALIVKPDVGYRPTPTWLLQPLR